MKNYGVIKGNEIEPKTFQLDDIVEKPKQNPPSNLAVFGRYIFTPQIFFHLEKLHPDAGGEIHLTDAIKSMLRTEECFGRIIEGKRFDIGSTNDYVHLLNILTKRD